MAESGGKIELARAYVQIVPSFDGLGKKISAEFDGAGSAETKKALENSGSKLGKTLSKAVIKAAKVGLAAAGAGIAASFIEGARLEQSIGGVETLFKESAQKVKDYAADAFQKAGISANDYMEQATSFAASLISSLEGDTSAAADYADMAMQDMSDNANKYGTDIESIQNAYQGFMRKTYVMLDNLKIGYGGTKSEMQRLLEDAEEISGIEYNIDNLSDVFSAIHVIQTELGITGTTAQEAETTFSGSFAQMKAAAKNLLGYMSTGAGDVDEAVDDLWYSVETFVSNAVRMLKNIYKAIDEIGNHIDESIADKLGISIGLLQTLEAVAKGVLTAMAAQFAVTQIATKFGDVALSIGSIKTALSTVGGSIAKFFTNPFTIAIAAGTTVALGLNSVIEKMADSIDVTGEKMTDFYLTDYEKQLFDDIDSLISDFDELSSQIDKTKDDIDTQAGSADELIDRLYELNRQTERTDTEQSEMESIVETLNSTYDDLNLEIDEQTGLLNKNETAVRDLVEQQLQQAKVAAVSEQLTELYEDQYEAEKKVAEAQKVANDEAAEYNEAMEALAEYKQLVNKYPDGGISGEDLERLDELRTVLQDITGLDYYSSNVEDFKEAIINMGSAEAAISLSEASDGLDKINSKIEDLSDWMSEDYGVAADEATQSTDEFRKALENIATDEEIEKQFTELTDGIAEIQEDYTTQVQDTMDSVWDSFDLFSSKSLYDSEGNLKTTKSDLQKALDSNLEYIQGWLDDMDELTERGISDKLMETLQEAGINSAAEVHAMTAMTDTELQEYCRKFDEAYGYVDDVAEYELSQVTQANAEAIATLIEDTTGKKVDVEEVYKALAEGSVDSYVNALETSIEESREQAIAAASTLGTSVGDGFKWGMSSVAETMGTTFEDLYGEEFSTSMYDGMYIAGQYAGQGFADGIESEKSFVGKITASMGKLVQQTMNMTLAIGSPSKEMRKIGAYASEGFALGIGDNADMVGNTSAMIGQEAMNGVRSEFNSPQIAFSTRAAVDTAVNANVNLTDKDSQKQATFNLILDGNRIAQVTAPYLDIINGASLSFAGRSVAM